MIFYIKVINCKKSVDFLEILIGIYLLVFLGGFIRAFFGPIILSILTVIILWGRMRYLQLYLVFMLFNLFVNKILKKIIQSPRPVNHDKNMIYKIKF